VALRRGPRDARAKGERSSKIARSHCVGHALAIGGVVLAAAFLGMTLPLVVIRYFVVARSWLALESTACYDINTRAVGPYAGRLPRLGCLVVSDGLSARGRFNGSAGTAGQQHG
jgi:hypothetical protein